jgi:hypothetical protein
LRALQVLRIFYIPRGLTFLRGPINPETLLTLKGNQDKINGVLNL